MNKKLRSALLNEYDTRRPHLEQLAQNAVNLVREATKNAGIKHANVTYRVKGRDSLEGKLRRKDYAHIDAITDLVGVRVVVPFSDQIDEVERAVRGEFTFVDQHRADKRPTPTSKSFTYASLHLVCTLGQGRAQLSEYNAFALWPFEIQIRTTLQHAWSEVEHGIGYKGPVPIGGSHERALARVSALLELADAEFLRIRDEALAPRVPLEDMGVTWEQAQAEKLPTLARIVDYLYPYVRAALWPKLADGYTVALFQALTRFAERRDEQGRLPDIREVYAQLSAHDAAILSHEIMETARHFRGDAIEVFLEVFQSVVRGQQEHPPTSIEWPPHGEDTA